jgi:hypothetical protein
MPLPNAVSSMAKKSGGLVFGTPWVIVGRKDFSELLERACKHLGKRQRRAFFSSVHRSGLPRSQLILNQKIEQLHYA